MISGGPTEAIERFLAGRGQRATSIRRQLFNWRVIFGRGLSSLSLAYRVVALSNDGTSNTYTFAYDMAGESALGRSGLKRFANGSWFDAD